MPNIVVYVEDEPNDAFFMERAFKQSAPALQLKILNNGLEAQNYFETESVLSPENLQSALVLLDLNLPGASGLDVLRNIRDKEGLKHLPVIMYTSSNQTVDIDQAYASGCNGYLIKPQSSQRLHDIIASLTGFWLRDNQYPRA